ncbi:uncharacterized protein LOC125823271 [Solanum verrucosum]|uniref:uncharacterized protein LOC125823271 n=1 Tax=Solanum verrucosum TaxID=315347 RepID=UPI0020D1AF4D|nr:uncharacterized protein LOC125823271 [Solanum verrucosum]
MKALDDTYVPVGTNSDNLAAMINQLKFDLGKLHQNQVNVRAFDGVQIDTLGAVNLDIQVGPTDFNVEFEVLDINISYNLLLGRPFIHMAEANGFEPGFGLGKHFQGIVEPIQIPAKEAKFGLGYVPIDVDKAEMKNKSVDQALARPIPHLYQSFWYDKMSTIVVSEKESGAFLRRLMRSSRKRLGHQASIESQVVEVTQYPTSLANVVPVAKKDEKIRICVDYSDLNKASSKDNFPLPNIHILIDNCANHEMQSFVDCYAGYHQS